MTRASLFAVSLLALSGCGNQLSGTIDDLEVGEFADGIYFELRYVEDGIDQHDLFVWLMPMEDSCTVFPSLLSGLADARAAIDEQSLAAEDYCGMWESVWAEHMDTDPFWMARYALRAQPRAADAGVTGSYPWLSRTSVNDNPVFDADLARYETPSFAACASEFEGDSLYGPTIHAATGGTLEVTDHTSDEEMSGRIDLSLEAGEASGTFETTFCPGAADWPLEFGLGL